MLHFKISDAGYPVYYFEKTGTAICTAHIVAKCGSAHEDADSYGVAHFLEHMCFQGTPIKNKHQISREGSLIGDYNAYTSNFHTAYYFEALNEDFIKGFKLLKEIVFDSCYPEKEFEKEKDVIVEEWRMYDNKPTVHLNNFVYETSFGCEEMHGIIGSYESIQAMTPEKLHRYRNKFYGKGNIAVVVVGDLGFDNVMKVVNENLPKTNDAESTKPCLQNYLAKDSKYSFEIDRFEQSAFALVLKWPNSKEIMQKNDLANFFAAALYKLLGEYIRDDLGLCYGVWGSQLQDADKAYMKIYMLTSKKKLVTAEKEMENIFKDIKDKGFPQEIYEISKKENTFDQTKILESTEGIASTISSGISESKDEYWFINEGHQCLDPKWLNNAANSFSNEDLRQFANEWLVNETKFTMLSSKGK